MDCPRCGGPVTVFELGDAVSRVCEDCSYVGVLVDHRSEAIDIESWDEALGRLQTEFPELAPDGIARIDDDTTPPEAADGDDATAGDSGFEFRGTPESTTVAESGPEPGADFPVDQDRPDVRESRDVTVVEGTDQPDEGGEEMGGQSAEIDSGGDSGAARTETSADPDEDTSGAEEATDEGKEVDAGETTEAVDATPADAGTETGAEDELDTADEDDERSDDAETGDEETDCGDEDD